MPWVGRDPSVTASVYTNRPRRVNARLQRLTRCTARETRSPHTLGAFARGAARKPERGFSMWWPASFRRTAVGGVAGSPHTRPGDQ